MFHTLELAQHALGGILYMRDVCTEATMAPDAPSQVTAKHNELDTCVCMCKGLRTILDGKKWDAPFCFVFKSIGGFFQDKICLPCFIVE